MMARDPKIITVTVSTAGTRVPVVSDGSQYQYARSATFRAAHANAGAVFIGDSQVSSTVYSDRLVGNETGNNMITVVGDSVDGPGGSSKNYVNLAAWYIDAATNGDKVFVTIQIDEP